jgi:hypothetical protein
VPTKKQGLTMLFGQPLFLSGCCLKTEVIKQLYYITSMPKAGIEPMFVETPALPAD